MGVKTAGLLDLFVSRTKIVQALRDDLYVGIRQFKCLHGQGHLSSREGGITLSLRLQDGFRSQKRLPLLFSVSVGHPKVEPLTLNGCDANKLTVEGKKDSWQQKSGGGGLLTSCPWGLAKLACLAWSTELGLRNLMNGGGAAGT